MSPMAGQPKPSRARAARERGLGGAFGIVNGLLFAMGIWLALLGFVLFLFR